MPKPNSAVDPDSLKIRERQERRREKRMFANRKAVMGTREGREWMWDILSTTGMYRSSFTGNSETFFREGERNIGLKLTAELTRDCIEEYTLMQKEAVKRDADEQAELDSPDDEKPKP